MINSPVLNRMGRFFVHMWTTTLVIRGKFGYYVVNEIRR